MSEYTKSQWVFEGGEVVSGGNVIARADRSHGNSFAPTTRDANMRLCAASLVMLTALKRVGCQDEGACGPDEDLGRCFVCAAVALAEGTS